MNKHEIIRDALALSSGTLAKLTGRHTYEALVLIQTSFVLFVGGSAQQYESWMEAWVDFWNS